MIRSSSRSVERAARAGLVAWSLAAAAIHPLAAQTPGRAPTVLEIPASARALALGGAWALGTGDADHVFHNPSLVERARGMSLGLLVLGGESLALSLAAATEWMGGGVGIGVQALEYGRAATEETPYAGGLDPLTRGGAHATGELAATAAYGRQVRGVRAGVALKVLDQRIRAQRDLGWAVDLGASREVKGVTLGLAVQDLGPALDVGAARDLPTRVTLGAARYGRPLGPLDVGGAMAVTRRADGEWLPGGGLEVGYYPVTGRTFVARVGARRVPEGEASPFTFGGSFWGDDLVLDYAFQPMGQGDGVHRVTLGWR